MQELLPPRGLCSNVIGIRSRCELAANHIAVFLNYAYWTRGSFSEQGVNSGGNFTINNTEYSVAALGALHAAVEGGNKIGPYAGIGYDSTHFSSGPLSLSLDVGAIYTGQPKVALSTDKSVPGLDSNLRAEEKKIEDKIKYFSFYPVIMLAGKFRF